LVEGLVQLPLPGGGVRSPSTGIGHRDADATGVDGDADPDPMRFAEVERDCSRRGLLRQRFGCVGDS